MLKVFTCTQFDGYYPVGVAAVVVAGTKEEAAERLTEKLISIGLKQYIRPEQMTEMLTSVPYVALLCDGDY